MKIHSTVYKPVYFQTTAPLCSNIGVALKVIAGIGAVALLTASALFTVEQGRLVPRDISEMLGNVQILFG